MSNATSLFGLISPVFGFHCL